MRCRDGVGAAVVAVALAMAGCATAPRSTDWREAVRAGDYRLAYADLYQAWRDGTPDVKAATLRHAWRSPEIMAVARADLAQVLSSAARAHTGDLASFERAVTSGPMDERVEFAKLLDRTIDVEKEIAAVHAGRAEVAPVAAAQPPHAAAPPRPSAPPKPYAPETPASVPIPPAAPEAKAERAPRAPSRPAASARVTEAKAMAVWRCRGAECDKAWAAAERFVGANSDKRIRSVTEAAIETYPPIVLGEVGLAVAKVSLGGGESEMRLTVNCRAGMIRQTCPASELRIYNAFPEFLRSAMAR